MGHIMTHTAAVREKGGRYVFLIKAARSETWWPECADHIAFIHGRIGFDLSAWFIPADDKQQPTVAFFAGTIAVFDKSWRGDRFSYISRTALEAKGQAFMTLAQFAAEKANPLATYTPVRQTAERQEAENRIWPLEVGFMFDQVKRADVLYLTQQNKLKANINQLWLELLLTSKIITVACGLVSSMLWGWLVREIIVDNFAGGCGGKYRYRAGDWAQCKYCHQLR